MRIKTIRIKKGTELSPGQAREVKGMIIALSLFASGIIIGAGVIKSASADMSEIFSIFDSFITLRASQKIYQTFLNSLLINLIFIVLAFCSGMSCTGLPVSVSLPIIRGLGVGVLSGHLFSEYAMTGIGYYLLTILPGAVVASTAMLIGCNCSSIMSIDILATVLSKKQSEPGEFVNYFKKYMVLTVITVAASLIDCILTKSFSYLFTL